MNQLLCHILYLYYELVRHTAKIQFSGFEPVAVALSQRQSLVMSTPHTVLFAVIVALKGYPATILASQSKDGSLVSYVLKRIGFRVVRGSSSRGAVGGLNGALKELGPGHIVGLTFDGPKGPPFVPKKGVAFLLKHSTGDSFLLLVKFKARFFGLYRGYVNLRSWDRFHLILPFARFEIEAIRAESKEPVNYLNFLESRSRDYYGHLYSNTLNGCKD